ncbi:hypothetical protein STEG23_011544, partial [Scotinomys teguina]
SVLTLSYEWFDSEYPDISLHWRWSSGLYLSVGMNPLLPSEQGIVPSGNFHDSLVAFTILCSQSTGFTDTSSLNQMTVEKNRKGAEKVSLSLSRLQWNKAIFGCTAVHISLPVWLNSLTRCAVDITLWTPRMPFIVCSLLWQHSLEHHRGKPVTGGLWALGGSTTKWSLESPVTALHREVKAGGQVN